MPREPAGVPHHHNACSENNCGGDENGTRTVPVGQRADDGLTDAPDDILQCDREAERGGGNADVQGYGPHEQAEALAQAHAQ